LQTLNKNMAFPLILSAGSGTGKTTITRALKDRYPDRFHVSISATTRPPRGNERDGIDYHFVDNARFSEMIRNGKLIEWAHVHDHLYGTPRDEIDNPITSGKIVLLDIDIQGGIQIISTVPDVVSVFLLPPSMDELRRRLMSRRTEDNKQIELRIKTARSEIEKGVASYDYILINSEVEMCVEYLLSIIRAEQLKSWRIQRSKTLLAFLKEGTKVDIPR